MQYRTTHRLQSLFLENVFVKKGCPQVAGQRFDNFPYFEQLFAFRAFSRPKISEDKRSLPKITEEDPKMFELSAHSALEHYKLIFTIFLSERNPHRQKFGTFEPA